MKRWIVNRVLERMGAILWLNNWRLREENAILRSHITMLQVERDNLSRQLFRTSREIENLHDWATRLLDNKIPAIGRL